LSLALRAAIALHPAAWREKHADAVLGTLMDVADERGGRVPVGETLNLAVRGFWLRVRGSVTFWACLLIVIAMVVGSLARDVYESDGSLAAHLLKLSPALSVVALILGTLGGWTGARARIADIAGVRARLRRLAADSVPPLVVTAVACLVAFVIVCLRFGLPWVAWPAGVVLASQAALVVASLAIGELLGAALPRVLVIFVAPATVAILLLTLAWGSAYQGLAYVFDASPFVRSLAVVGVLVAVTVGSAAVRTLWMRALPAVALVAVCAFLVLALPTMAQSYSEPIERSRSELVCSTDEPVVCLWPEQDAAFGDSLRAELSTAYARGRELGLPVDDAAPSSVARFAMTGIPAPVCNADIDDCRFAEYDDLEWGLGVSGLRPDEIVSLYALSIAGGFWQAPASGEGVGDMPALQFAIAIVLGVHRDEAWPAKPDPYTGQRQYDPAGVPDEAAALALVQRWIAEGLNGVRAPC